jgi:PHP family Zn ribbon phosphoesterase
MTDLYLPQTIAGYASPICPHCDKEYGPEVANRGPLQCAECACWFQVTTETVYRSEEMPDYKSDPPKAASKTPKNSAARQSRVRPRKRAK